MDIFLARQAIYNRNCKVVGYELLFRNSEVNRFDVNVNADEAALKLISNCSAIGLNEITNNKRAYINFTKKLILNDTPKFLPKEKIIIEILENIRPNAKVLDTMKKYKNQGYVMALDDVSLDTKYLEFGSLIDIYKIDFMKTTKEERKKLLDDISFINPLARFLAEKVENDDDYNEVTEESRYLYYQGYYFSKPILVSAKDIALRNKTCFQVMTELLNDNFNVDKIENIIKSDMGISFKLIKLLNSAAFSFVQEITSIKQAIVLLGREELNKWITLVGISEMESKNDEEMTSSNIIRGRFCELIAKEVKPEISNLCFMAGLFSNLDSYMGKDMKIILDDMPLKQELKVALLTGDNEIGYILRLVKAYEKMYIEEIDVYTKVLNIKKEKLIDIYFKSIEWSNNMLSKYY